MCKFCNNKPLRLLVQPLTNFNEAEEVKTMLNTLSHRIDAQTIEEDDEMRLTPLGEELLKQYTHVREVALLRTENYQDARRVINTIRSYK